METIDPDKYDFMWRVGNFSYFPISYWLHGIYKSMDCIATYDGRMYKFYLSKEDRRKLSDTGLEMIENGMPDFRKRTAILINQAKELFPELEKKDLSKPDNHALADEFEELITFTQRLWELFFYTEYFMHDKVMEKAEKLGINTGEYLTSSPKETWMSREFYDRCLLAMNPSERSFQEHVKKYLAIHYNEGGPTLTVESLKDAIRGIKNPEQKSREIEEKHSRILSQRKHHPLADSIREMAELKYMIRSFINKTLFGDSLINRYLDEISRRTGINDFSLFHYKEIIAILRRKTFVLGKFSGWDEIVDEEAGKIINLMENNKEDDPNIIHGTVGNKGYYTGKVKYIPFDTKADVAAEISKMDVGDVLVTESTGPEMIKACHKAGAIVTEEGGICSHAAIVSRELGIPSILATKRATEVLKDGDIVEVDAEKGIVRKLNRK